MTKKDILSIQNDLRGLNNATMDFLEDVGYINKGTHDGGNSVLNEGKREIVLTIKTFRDLSSDELLTHFTGDENDE